MAWIGSVVGLVGLKKITASKAPEVPGTTHTRLTLPAHPSLARSARPRASYWVRQLTQCVLTPVVKKAAAAAGGSEFGGLEDIPELAAALGGAPAMANGLSHAGLCPGVQPKAKMVTRVGRLSLHHQLPTGAVAGGADWRA